MDGPRSNSCGTSSCGPPPWKQTSRRNAEEFYIPQLECASPKKKDAAAPVPIADEDEGVGYDLEGDLAEVIGDAEAFQDPAEDEPGGADDGGPDGSEDDAPEPEEAEEHGDE